MNPDFNDQNNHYTGKTLFDTSSGQPDYPQFVPPPSRRRGVLIIAIVAVVFAVLIGALYIGVKVAQNNTQSTNTSIADQNNISNSNQSVASEFIKTVMANKSDSARSMTAPQFQSKITQEQFDELVSTMSGATGADVVASLSSTHLDGEVQFTNTDTTEQNYQANAYIFDIKKAKSDTPFLYAQVKVAKIDGKWQVYAFDYRDEPIQPALESDGKFQITK